MADADVIGDPNVELVLPCAKGEEVPSDVAPPPNAGPLGVDNPDPKPPIG